MAWLFKTRQDGVEANSDAAATHYRAAEAAKKRGDTRALREHLAAAREFDKVAEDFADGRNDDVVRDRQRR